MSVKIWNGEEYAEYDRPASTEKRGTVKVQNIDNSPITGIPTVPTIEKLEATKRDIVSQTDNAINGLKQEAVLNVTSSKRKGCITVTKGDKPNEPAEVSVGQANDLLVPDNFSCDDIGKLHVGPTKIVDVIPGVILKDALPIENGGTNATKQGAALINLGVYSGTTTPDMDSSAKNALDGCIYFQLN